MMKKKIFKVVVSHPIQYHAVLWRELAKIEALDFEVFFCSDHGQGISVDKDFGLAFKWDVPLKEGYKSKTFKNYGFGNGFFKYINPGLIFSVLFNKNDIVYFHGVSNFTAYLVFWISKFKAAKTIIRNIAHLQDFEHYGGLRYRLKDLIFGNIFRTASHCLYIGTHNKTFYKSFHVNDEKLKHAPHVVDNDFFQKRQLSKEKSIEFRKELGIGNHEVVILFCGKLIPKKQPEMLLKAFDMANFNQDATLLFVGEGILSDRLKNQSIAINKTDKKQVKFLGFKNQSELPSMYSISDVLALPSFHQETWGLVVNEALNFSLSIIVSDNVGCGPNLVEDKTGFVVDRNQIDELQTALESLVNSETTLKNFKNNAKPLIDNWSVREYIASVKQLINE